MASFAFGFCVGCAVAIFWRRIVPVISAAINRSMDSLLK
jgi:hypothetical protein